jgi:hypothetical protein
MNRRLQLCLGVSACALLGALSLPTPVLAGDNGRGNAQDRDIDPNGGFQHECGEPGGCAEAGESFETLQPPNYSSPPLATPTLPRSGGGGLSTGDSVRGTITDGGLGGNRGGSSLGR